MGRAEAYLKEYLREKRFMSQLGNNEGTWPEFDTFYNYCQGRLEGEELERMQVYLSRHVWAQNMLLAAKQLEEEELSDARLPAGLEDSVKKLVSVAGGKLAKCPYCSKPITPFRKPLKLLRTGVLIWFFISLGAFLLSFFFRGYFMQCLVVCVLTGTKAIIEARAVKTQIMIYKALDSGEAGPQNNRVGKDLSYLDKNRDGGI